MSNREDVINSSGNEHTGKLLSAIVLLQKYTNLIEKDDVKIEWRSIYEVIYNNYSKEEEYFPKEFILMCLKVLTFHKIFH